MAQRSIAAHYRLSDAARLAPGVCLAVAVSAAALLVQQIETVLTGRAWIEALVLAILLGTGVRTAWAPDARWQPGIQFSAKTLLEIAVMLLGLSVSAATLASTGAGFLLGIAGLVAVAIIVSFLIGRALGLPTKMALLVACGNSICGNSAIAAVAPIIDASGDDVATSIAFTAVLGVIVVIGLPVLALATGLTPLPFGALAGMTVYAVPQVIAAAAPLGSVAVQIGTLAKLARVLMLGPVCVVLSLLAPRLREGAGSATVSRPELSQLVPWFIVGFLGLAAIRSTGAVPAALLVPTQTLATTLTIKSMAALGLGCDVRMIARAGSRVVLAVTSSLLALGALSWALIRLLGLA